MAKSRKIGLDEHECRMIYFSCTKLEQVRKEMKMDFFFFLISEEMQGISRNFIVTMNVYES